MFRYCAILSALTAGLIFAVSPAPKRKAPPAPPRPAAKSAAKARPKAPATAVKKAPEAKGNTARAAAARRSTSTGKGAVYSRSSRYGRNQLARRGTAPARPSSNWQTQPTPERYREIQQALADKGFFKGEVNGTWSKDSVDALKDFQRSQNLEPDGKLGSLSLIALGLGPKRVVSASNLPPPPPPPAVSPAKP